jgi:NAD(P)H dehydrogenase (quinone)
VNPFKIEPQIKMVNCGEMPGAYTGKDPGINRLGSFMGAMGQSTLDMSGKEATLDPGDRLTAELLGERVAIATQRWSPS